MNLQKLTKTSAFSLIELMVVIAIVALLAAVAVPSYKSYIAKSHIAEINGFINSQMQAVAAAYSTGGSAPAAIVSPDSYISSTGITATVTTTGGTVVANFVTSPAIDANFATAVVVTYTALDNGTGALQWTCAITGGVASGGTSGGTGIAGIKANLYFTTSNGVTC